MSSADKSSSGRTRIIKAKTLANFKYETGRDFTHVKPSDALTVLLRKIGDVERCETCCIPVCDLSGAFVFPLVPTDFSSFEASFEAEFGIPFNIPAPPDGYPDERPAAMYFFGNTCNATSYTATFNIDGTDLSNVQHFIGIFNTPGFFQDQTGWLILYPLDDYGGDVYTFTVKASNECSQSIINAEFGCFLEGSLVAMSDGSFKPIESVEIGDLLLGAFGEVNPVLALHRPILGGGYVVNVNNEHKTTAHHPHVTPDKKFACVEPTILKNMTYGKEHTVIVNKEGKKEKRVMEGLLERRITKLEIGSDLQTLTGSKKVTTLENVKMSPLTQVYHLVMGGSHTFIVDGYAVSGWCREDDFNYDTWTTL
jgi:hypothetical protein